MAERLATSPASERVACGRVAVPEEHEARGYSIVDAPEMVFDDPYAADAGGGGNLQNYDVSPDGEESGFSWSNLLSPATGGVATAQVNVVLNWFQELTERVPVP